MFIERGRPNNYPIVLIKMTFMQYMFGIRSMFKTIEEIETNYVSAGDVYYCCLEPEIESREGSV